MTTITPTTAQLRMLASIRRQQWAIRPDAVQDYAMSALEAAEKCAQPVADSVLSLFYDLRQPMGIDGDGIAHIPIKGALLDKSPAIYEMLGLATRYQTVINETRAAVEQGARGILYHVDSPGGTVAGVIEAGDGISNAGVPTAVHCNGLSCSAAYWLSSCAGAIIATPSASVGNIGAIISWADCSAMWEGMGVTFKALVSDGADLKSTFHLEPDEAQLAFLQESINEAGAAFRAQVETGRIAAGAELDPEVWRAGWYSGDRAWSMGLIDGIGSSEVAQAYLVSKLNS